MEHDLGIILEKPTLLAAVVDIGDFIAQFPATLYRFFEVHKKEDELISFVINFELASGMIDIYYTVHNPHEKHVKKW
jgi:hypothetical protein